MFDRMTAHDVGVVVVVASMTLLTPASSVAQATVQPRVSTRSIPLLERDGLRFRDLNRSGTLDLFEDWRLTADARARDLVSRMTLEEKAGARPALPRKTTRSRRWRSGRGSEFRSPSAPTRVITSSTWSVRASRRGSSPNGRSPSAWRPCATRRTCAGSATSRDRNADLARSLTRAYVEGFQHGAGGIDAAGVLTVVKHWVGYGAARNGYDSHSYYGRFATFPAQNLEYHVRPFLGAFAANVAGVMPTYSILEGATWDGRPIEAVGAAFNPQVLTGMLRGR